MRRSLLVAAAGIVASASVGAAIPGRAAPVGTSSASSVCTKGTWTQTPANVTPKMGGGDLNGVTIVSASDAWAVGQYFNSTSLGSLWEHWDGAHWKVVTSGGLNVVQESVINFGADDVWAAGFINTGGAVISHWNGKTIQRASIPSGGMNVQLNELSGSSPTDIWALGTSSVTNGATTTLLYHYNGATWSLTKPLPGSEGPGGILDLSPTDVYLLELVGPFQEDLYRYNGVKWSLAQSDVPIDNGLVGSSDSDLYGADEAAADEGIDHWNGSSWHAVGTFTHEAQVVSNVEDPAGTVWSAGVIFSGGPISVYVARNDVRQTTPSAVMTQAGSLSGIASGSGRVIAVGDDDDSEPIVLMRCS